MTGTTRLETLQGLVERLERHGDRNAVTALTKRDSVRWSHADLAREARRVAAGLHAAGIAPGETVGVMAPNSGPWVAVCLGIVEAGAVVTPFDTQMPAAELRHAVADSGVRHLFVGGDAAARLEAVSLDEPPKMISLDVDGGDEDGTPEGWRAWQAEPSNTPPRVGPDDTAALFYTSGTTGPPKGVPLSHRNIASNLTALLEQELAYPSDRIFNPLPYHHIYPFSLGLLTPLLLGGAVVLPYSVLGPQIVRALREGEATVILGVPRLYRALDDAIQRRVAERGAMARHLFDGLSALSRFARHRFGWRLGRRLFGGLHRRMAPSVRMVVSGGAALDPVLGERLRALGWEVATGYGLTETSPILTFNPPHRLRLEAAGVPLPGVDLRIHGGGGSDAPGEVRAKGPNVFSGYRGLPEKTAAAFDEDGYFRTGDLGWMDGDGYLHLAGRASEMIVLSGGENIDPERVEKALLEAEVIHDAGVLEHNDRLVAVIQPDAEAIRGLDDESVDRLIHRALSFQCRHLPSHHRVDDFRITLDPLPRTRLGKMRRHKLRELIAALADGTARHIESGPMAEEEMASEDRQLLQEAAVRRVWDALAQRFADRRLTPDSHLRLDLGIDSLGWLNLTLELQEQTGVTLDEDAVSRVETVRDLLREAAEAEEGDRRHGDLVEQLREPEAVLDEARLRWLAPRSAFQRGVGAALWALDRWWMKAWFRLRVHGVQYLPDGPVLLAPNHCSVLDPPALGAALPPPWLDRIYWGGWTGMMFTSATARFVSRATRVLPVDPAAGPRASLALGAAALARGESLVWFPEGRRSEDGTLQPFQPGVGLLLAAHPVPVVPVWIDGTAAAMPPGRSWPGSGRLAVTFGPPVRPEVLEKEGRGERPHERIADGLRGRVAALNGRREDREKAHSEG